MDAPDVAQLLESAAPTPTTTLDTGTIAHRARRARRRRRGAVASASLLIVGLLVGAATLLPGPGPRPTVVAGPPSPQAIPVDVGDRAARVEVGLLDGTRLRLTVPDVVGRTLSGATFADLELSGSIYSDWARGRGWRIDVRVGSVETLVPGGEPLPLPAASGASAATVDRAEQRLGLQFGSWAVVVSGDSLTDVEIDGLLAGVAFAGTPDGFVEYRGPSLLWIADSPNAYLDRGDVAVSVFMRECAARAVQPTATGLIFDRVDDPARGRPLTVLCDPARRIEIWLATPQPLSDEEIDRVDVDVLSVGPTLAAIQSGRHP